MINRLLGRAPPERMPPAVAALLADLPGGGAPQPIERMAGVAVQGTPVPGAWVVQSARHAAASRLVLRYAPNVDLSEGVIVVLGRPVRDLVLHFLGGASRFVLGAGGRGFHGQVNLGLRSSVIVGEETTAMNVLVMTRHSEVVIGRDCMISGDVVVNAAQHHGIVDLSERPRRARPASARIELGDHVWLGQRAYLLGGTRIGSGAIVGAGAVVAGDRPGNCVVAGNPARVLRENVTWSRQVDAIDSGAASYIRSLSQDSHAGPHPAAGAASAADL